MRKNGFRALLFALLPAFCAGCASGSGGATCVPTAAGALVCSDRVLDDAYIGNGVQWDPYEVREADGLSASDKRRLVMRLEWMSPRFIRVMSGIRSHVTDGRFDPTRNMDDLHMILGYCNTHGVTVLLGDWGDGPVDRERRSVDEGLIDCCGEMVRYLVEECGYTCIRYYNMVNEPNGWWSSTEGDYALWLRAAVAMDAVLRRHGMGGRVEMVAPDAAVWTTAETNWVSDSRKDSGEAFGLYDIHTYPSKSQINTGEYSGMIAAYRAAAPASSKMILGELGIKYVDPRDAELDAENKRRIAADPHASIEDSQMFVFDTVYGIDVADAVMQTAAAGYSGCVVWMLDDAMHIKEPGRLKIWGFWNILGEERYGAEKERIRPWYYAMSLLCRYFPQGCRITASEVERVDGVRSMVGRTDEGVTLAVVNTHADCAVELTLRGFEASGLSLYVYGEGLKLDGERLLPTEQGVALEEGARIRLEPETMLVYTSMTEPR